MNCPRFMAPALVLLASLGIGAAQPPQRCEIVSIEVPATVDQGSPVVFRAKLSTVVPTAIPEYKWQINAGTITAGEGTSSITVDTIGLGGQTIEATVSVSGISTVCLTSATRSIAVMARGFICGLPFDQYGDIRFEDEEARLDNFAIQLFNFKDATGYILVYAASDCLGPRASRPPQAASSLKLQVESEF